MSFYVFNSVSGTVGTGVGMAIGYSIKKSQPTVEVRSSFVDTLLSNVSSHPADAPQVVVVDTNATGTWGDVAHQGKELVTDLGILAKDLFITYYHAKKLYYSGTTAALSFVGSVKDKIDVKQEERAQRIIAEARAERVFDALNTSSKSEEGKKHWSPEDDKEHVERPTTRKTEASS